MECGPAIRFSMQLPSAPEMSSVRTSCPSLANCLSTGSMSRLGSTTSAQPIGLSRSNRAFTTGRTPETVLPEPVSPSASVCRQSASRSMHPSGNSARHSGMRNVPSDRVFAAGTALPFADTASIRRSSIASAAEMNASIANSSM